MSVNFSRIVQPLGACLVCLVSMALQPVAAQVVTLQQAIEQATKNDLQVQTMQAQFVSAQEKVDQAWAKFYPQVQYNRLGTNTRRRDMDSAFLDRNYENRQWSWELQLPIYRRENLVFLRQTELEMLMAKERLELARNEILLKTAKSYIDVVKAYRQWEFVDLQQRNAQLRWEHLRLQFDRGVLSEQELMDAQAKRLYVRSQRMQVANDLVGKRLELQRLLGDPKIDSLFTLPEHARLGVLSSGNRMQLQACLAEDLQSHPSVNVGKIEMQLNQNELTSANAEFYPAVDLTFTRIGINQTGNTYSTFPSQYVENATTLKLSVPIFNGGSSLSKRRAAIAMSQKAEAILNTAVEQLKVSRQQAQLTLESTAEMDDVLTQAQLNAHGALFRLEQSVKGGIRSAIDVLTPLEEHRKRLLEYELTRYDTVNEWVKLISYCHAESDSQIRQLSDQMRTPLKVVLPVVEQPEMTVKGASERFTRVAPNEEFPLR